MMEQTLGEGKHMEINDDMEREEEGLFLRNSIKF